MSPDGCFEYRPGEQDSTHCRPAYLKSDRLNPEKPYRFRGMDFMPGDEKGLVADPEEEQRGQEEPLRGNVYVETVAVRSKADPAGLPGELLAVGWDVRCIDSAEPLPATDKGNQKNNQAPENRKDDDRQKHKRDNKERVHFVHAMGLTL